MEIKNFPRKSRISQGIHCFYLCTAPFAMSEDFIDYEVIHLFTCQSLYEAGQNEVAELLLFLFQY